MDDTSQVGFALQAGLSVIPCFGEKLEEREAGRTMEVKITMMMMMEREDNGLIIFEHFLMKLKNLHRCATNN